MSGPLQEHTTSITAKLATSASYTTSGGLTLAGAMDFLNDNALALGVILGVATFIVNWHYQHKHYKLAEAAKKNR